MFNNLNLIFMKTKISFLALVVIFGMSNYKATICLENIVEPHYFTEKFYAGVQARCIPIYHAHDTVKNQILKGALWVDPIDFDFDVNKTLEFALAQDRDEYVEANLNWLKTPLATSAELSRVFLRLGKILEHQQKQLKLIMNPKN